MPSSPEIPDRGLSLPPAARAWQISLFLDMDGVLAPLADTPDAVVADPRRTLVLQALDRSLEGRVAVISGRTLSEIDRIAEGASLSAAGVHGLERRRRDGSIQAIEPAIGVIRAVEAFQTYADHHPGVLVENKGVSVGLHYRAAPEAEAGALALAEAWASRVGLVVQAGKLVVELKTPGADKGTALTAFMAEPPFTGSIPIMLGDDLTDEAGFAAAESLGGFGILVGPPRHTLARFGLADVDAALTWLEAVAMQPEPV